MMTKEEIDKLADKKFEQMFDEWLVKNPTFAEKGIAFTEMLKAHFKYWFCQGNLNAVQMLMELEK
jgi:hypothetical protein